MNPQNTLSVRDTLQQKYNSARANLALMIVLTVVNIILLLVGSDSMLLFSATVPYFTSILAYAAVEYGLAANMTIFVVCVTITAVAILLYMLCWWLSKKRVGFMTTALVLFLLDSAFMVYLYVTEADVSGILDVIIHAWVIYYLIIGVSSGTKLKKLPDEPEVIPVEGFAPTEGAEQPPLTSSAGLYPADENVKARVLAEAQAAGHHIVYRRVKRVNELVIDGYVYDRLEALAETAHVLRATLNGVLIEVGFDGLAHSYIKVNNETVVRKLRLW